MELRTPTLDLLESYKDALLRGFQPDTTRPESGAEEIAAIEADPVAFLATKNDIVGVGLITLADGSRVQRLPSETYWMWDGEFCGRISLRWTRDGAPLPLHVLGHIGYTVVPWKQQRGYATQALKQILPHAKARGLSTVEITTDIDNLASQKVILAAGGVFQKVFDQGPVYAHAPAHLYKIALI